MEPVYRHLIELFENSEGYCQPGQPELNLQTWAMKRSLKGKNMSVGHFHKEQSFMFQDSQSYVWESDGAYDDYEL